MPQPITIYMKKHIDEIIKLTSTFRSNCQIKDLKKYLFLMPSNKINTYKIMYQKEYNIYLKNCCEELSIKKYTLSNLRDTHMTKAEEFRIRNNLSELEQNIITGHKSSNTDTKHYVDTPLKDLLEAVHGIIIGNVNVYGQVAKNVPEEIAKEECEVSNKCGYCGAKTCNDFSYLECMMCKNFITTISKIPYFKEQIKVIDNKIQMTSNKHDKEDYINIKRILVNFLYKLLKLEEET